MKNIAWVPTSTVRTTINEQSATQQPQDDPWMSLYTVNPGSGSPHLIETDLHFATYSGFLGSDYLLSHLGLDGDLTLKRLRDAFYETQLVMDRRPRF